MAMSDPDITVNGEGNTDAVVLMKQEPRAVRGSVREEGDRFTEEDKSNVKIEADMVDEVQFPSTSRQELINVKKEMAEATSFVGVKAEAENEELTTVKTEIKEEITVEETEVDALDCSAVIVGELCHHKEESAVADTTSNVLRSKQKGCVISVCAACGITFTSDPTCCSQTCGMCSEAAYNIKVQSQVVYEEEGTQMYTDCGKSFSVPSRLNKHICTCRDKNHFECNECGALLATEQNLHRHKLYHSGETPFLCNMCGKQFTESRSLRQHLNRQHKNEKPCQCKVCNKVFATEYILKTHSKVHSMNKSFACQECGKHFSRPSSVAIHARLHSGEKPYVCRECGRRFSVHHTLKIHYRIHTGEKPYDCNYCKRKFRVLQGLSLHLRTHTGEKPYRCNECGKLFAKYSVLKKHELTHKVKKSFECDKCGKTFLQSGYLKLHQLVKCT